MTRDFSLHRSNKHTTRTRAILKLNACGASSVQHFASTQLAKLAADLRQIAQAITSPDWRLSRPDDTCCPSCRATYILRSRTRCYDYVVLWLAMPLRCRACWCRFYSFRWKKAKKSLEKYDKAA
jgi:hypothetical protein